MFPGKLLIIGVTVSTLIVAASCTKKKNASTSKVSQATTNQPAAAKASEGEDIFNEFYKDENSAAQKENLSSKETFSPSGSNSASRSSGDEFTPDGRYVVQISTVVSERFAEKLKNKFTDAGVPAYIAEVQNPRPDLSGTYYRIRIGGFRTIAAARNFSENSLKSMGYDDYWIDNKANDNVGISEGSFGNSGSSYDNSSYRAPAAETAPTPVSTITEPSADWGSTSNTAPAASSAPVPTTTTTAPAVSPAPVPTTTTTPAVSPAPAQTSTVPPATTAPAAAPPSSKGTSADSSGWGTSGW